MTIAKSKPDTTLQWIECRARAIVADQANVAPPLKGDFERMARRRYQRGCVYLRGTREPVWEARWRESVIGSDGEEKRVLRSRVLGTKKQFKNKREALRELES